MKKAKVLAALLVLALSCAASMAGLMWLCGQWLVQHLRLEPALAGPALPLRLLGSAEPAWRRLGGAAVAGGLGLPVLVFGAVAAALFLPRRRELHGSARFASRQELVRAGLLRPDRPDDRHPSLIVGKLGNRFLLFRGQQFMFLAAPTRSGKGVGIVIPNLLHYRDSVVVLDIKGETFKLTAGFRAACGQQVHLFAPDSEDFITDCWNPLSYVRDDPRFRVSDLMSITNILYPPSEEVWASTAESLFLGLALYVMDTAREQGNFNIAAIKRMAVGLAFLKDEETFLRYAKEREGFEPLSADCMAHLLKFAQTSDKMRNSIVISFDQPLAIFSDPITARATARDTFDLREVRRRRMSVYVVIKPKNIDKFGRFLNLFFQQLLNLNMEVLPEEDPSLRHQCLLLLDEFPAMGRVAIIEKASAYMAGYNMRLLLIFQSRSQVKDRRLYDETGAQTLLTNMALQVCYAPRDAQDARDYSEMIGDMTWKSTSKSRQLSGKSGRSESVSDQRRAVLLPQEVKEIGMEREIVSMENMRPALVSKIFWYREPVFLKRANLPLPAIPDQSEPANAITPAQPSPVAFYEGASAEEALPAGTSFEVGFSPQRNALEVVMSLILQARTELFVASYAFTSREIAFALVEAKARGVDVRVVVDHAQNGDDQAGYRALDYLVARGVAVHRNENYAAMHHKFMVADGEHVQLGSFNYTASANLRNAETAIVLRHAPRLAAIYRTEWLRLASEPRCAIETIMAVDHGIAAMKKLGIFD